MFSNSLITAQILSLLTADQVSRALTKAVSPNEITVTQNHPGQKATQHRAVQFNILHHPGVHQVQAGAILLQEVRLQVPAEVRLVRQAGVHLQVREEDQVVDHPQDQGDADNPGLFMKFLFNSLQTFTVL
jgi:hypothetical protein